MNIIRYWLGEFSPKSWQRLSLLLIVQFQGMLILSWLTRTSDVGDATPFVRMISLLGHGRSEGNTGAWVFLACFCLFALLLVPWHLHLARNVWQVDPAAARKLRIVGMVSLVGVACVGIFDGQPLGLLPRSVSQVMHGVGATAAFGGHVLLAILSWRLLAKFYANSHAEQRASMAHPSKLLVSVVALGCALVPVCVLQISPLRYALKNFVSDFGIGFLFGIPFWEWLLMVFLMCWLFSMGRWFPASLTTTEDRV